MFMINASDLSNSLVKALLQVWGYLFVMHKIVFAFAEVGLAIMFCLVHMGCCFTACGHKTMLFWMLTRSL